MLSLVLHTNQDEGQSIVWLLLIVFIFWVLLSPLANVPNGQRSV